MFKIRNLGFAFFLLLGACSMFLPKGLILETPEDRLLFATGIYVAAQDTATKLYEDGVISPAVFVGTVAPLRDKAKLALEEANTALLYWREFENEEQALPKIEIALDFAQSLRELVEEIG